MKTRVRPKLYKQHTLSDYRKLQRNSYNYGGLGPNVDQEFFQRWNGKLSRMRVFNESVRSTNYRTFIERKYKKF